MNKEDILSRSREQKEDEGIIYAENKGRRYGVIGFSVMFIIIMFFNIFTKHNNFIPYCMYFGYISAEAYGRNQITHDKKLVVTTVFAAVSSILFLVCHIINVLGVGK